MMHPIEIGDLNQESERAIRKCSAVAIDIETSGLDWALDSIGLITIMTDKGKSILLRPDDSRPSRFIEILEDTEIRKLFHHAIFDLRFICNKWSCAVDQVACTKVMAKLLAPTDSSSLKDLLRKHFGLNLSKSEQQSNWLKESLSESQLNYALSDVQHLFDLYECLNRLLKESGLDLIADRALRHIPTRVILDLRQYPDIYSY